MRKFNKFRGIKQAAAYERSRKTGDMPSALYARQAADGSSMRVSRCSECDNFGLFRPLCKVLVKKYLENPKIVANFALSREEEFGLKQLA